MARPTVMTPDNIDKICERLAAGESLRSICLDEKLPAISTVLLAVVDDRDGFRNSYMRAREAGGFSHADRIIDVVDKVSTGEYESHQAKAMMDGLKWAAERMAPKSHSSRQEVEQKSTVHHIMPVPSSSSVEDWEKASDEVHESNLQNSG